MVRATELPPRLEARAHAHAGGRRVRGEDGPGEASVAAAKTRAAGRPRGSARARSRPRSRRAALRGCRDVPAQPSPRRARAPGRRRRSRRRRRAMKPPIDASRFGSAAAAYQATLPGVRCEHINGRLVQLPRNPGERRMLEVLWAAYEAGTGGVYMSKVDWATKLRCSVRSVYNYQRGLERKGLGEFQQLWAPLPDGKAGSRRGYVLARIGRGIFDTAWAEPFARRQPAAVDVTKELATRLGVELRERARLRAYHVSGRPYRLKRWGDPQPQKRRNRPGTSIAFNRQTLPDSPSHGGLLQSAPPDGGRGRREEDAPCSGPVARAGAPSSARACTSDGPRERNTGERRGSGAIANPMPLLRRDAIELAPSERFGALLYELLGQDGGDAS